MLVSSIARFNSVNTLNNAVSASIQAASNMANITNSAHTFGGEHDLSMLNKMDNKLSLDLLSNKLLYKITFLQENKDWILLTVFILLFVFSYVKQTSYVRERVESVLKRKNIDN